VTSVKSYCYKALPRYGALSGTNGSARRSSIKPTLPLESTRNGGGGVSISGRGRGVERTARRVLPSLRPARRSREQGRKRAGVGGGLGGVGARVEEARRLEQRVASATGDVAACSNVSVVLEHSRWQQKVARGCRRLRRRL
jgi:hypothetical protein